jgi:DNA polymerase-3 subunit beta
MNALSPIETESAVVAPTVTLPRIDLLDALKKLALVIPRANRKDHPIYHHAFIRSRPFGLELMATSPDNAIKCFVECRIDAPVSFSLHCKSLLKLIKAAKCPSVTFTDTGPDITMQLDAMKVQLVKGPDRTEYADDLHHFALKNHEFTRFEIPAYDLKTALDRVAVSMSDDESRYYLRGVCFANESSESQPSRLSLVSTDGHRLCRDTMPTDLEGSLIENNAILNAHSIKTLLKLINKKNCNGTVRFLQMRHRMHIELDDEFVLSAYVVDGSYPDYQRVIPSETGQAVIFNRQEILNLAKHLNQFQVERDGKVTMEITADRTTFSYRGAEISIGCQWNGGFDFAVGYNLQYLIDALSCFTCDSVTFHYGTEENAPLCPVLIRSPELPSYTSVLMPMRL